MIACKGLVLVGLVQVLVGLVLAGLVLGHLVLVRWTVLVRWMVLVGLVLGELARVARNHLVTGDLGVVMRGMKVVMLQGWMIRR